MKEFPLLTRICVSPGFDMEALLKAGYNSTNSYFSGKSRFNHSVIGWAGHTEDGGIFGNALQTYDYVKQNISLRDILDSIHVKTLLGGRIFLNTEDVIQEENINYPDNCQTLDVTRHDVIKQRGVKDIQFRFQAFSENISVSINLLGKSSACSRTRDQREWVFEIREVKSEKEKLSLFFEKCKVKKKCFHSFSRSEK